MIAIINPDAGEEILSNLKKLGHGKTMLCHRDMDPAFIRRCERYFEIVIGTSRLSPRYPDDIPFNTARAGNLAFIFVPSRGPIIDLGSIFII